jgi:molecular chaperone GrpE
MFFKKKKNMNDSAQENKPLETENTDNLSQPDSVNGETLTETENADFNAEEKMDTENETMEKLLFELKEAKDKYLRLVAEFDNFRKRNAKERIELSQTAGKEVIGDLLVVLDDSNRALKQMESHNDPETIKQGIKLVFNKLQQIMLSKGLKTMECVNLEFNPDLHEAITEIPAPNENMKGKIIDVIEDGYYLNDKLIRHAKVVVGN